MLDPTILLELLPKSQIESDGRLGWTARRCENCRSVQPFLVEGFRRTTKWLFGVEGRPKPAAPVVACHFCGTALRLQQKDPLAVARDWRPDQDLNLLIQLTNPVLGRVEPTAEPTDEQLRGLLVAVRKRSRGNQLDLSWRVQRNPWRGVILAAFAAAFATGGGLLGLFFLLPLQAAPWMLGAAFAAGFFLGLAVGCLVGLWVPIQIGRRRRMRKALRERLQANRLDLGRLYQVCRDLDPPLARLVAEERDAEDARERARRLD